MHSVSVSALQSVAKTDDLFDLNDIEIQDGHPNINGCLARSKVSQRLKVQVDNSRTFGVIVHKMATNLFFYLSDLEIQDGLLKIKMCLARPKAHV